MGCSFASKTVPDVPMLIWQVFEVTAPVLRAETALSAPPATMGVETFRPVSCAADLLIYPAVEVDSTILGNISLETCNAFSILVDQVPVLGLVDERSKWIACKIPSLDGSRRHGDEYPSIGRHQDVQRNEVPRVTGGEDTKQVTGGQDLLVGQGLKGDGPAVDGPVVSAGVEAEIDHVQDPRALRVLVHPLGEVPGEGGRGVGVGEYVENSMKNI